MPQGFEIEFLPVGETSCSGDAICVRYGSPETGYTINVIDGWLRVNDRDDNLLTSTPHYGRPGSDSQCEFLLMPTVIMLQDSSVFLSNMKSVRCG